MRKNTYPYLSLVVLYIFLSKGCFSTDPKIPENEELKVKLECAEGRNCSELIVYLEGPAKPLTCQKKEEIFYCIVDKSELLNTKFRVATDKGETIKVQEYKPEEAINKITVPAK